MRRVIFVLIALSIGTIVPLVMIEIALRFLPYNQGMLASPVNEANPVFHFKPDRTFTWSRDWNFSIVNKVRVNNAGYVNEQDYDENDPRPLFAIIGDSYVEAVMVPYAETINGRLARAVAPEARVYSLAASGAPLSQYLVWAKEARQRWKAQALAVVVISNDFDESHADYKSAPGFHHYVEQPSRELALQRNDYELGMLRWFVERSALLRYVLFNLQAHEHIKPYLHWLPELVRPARAEVFVGNTAAEADSIRLARSKAVVDAFLRDIVDYSDWPPDRVVFVVDGIRYPTDSEGVLTSYFVQMRTYFMDEARKAGFETIDMDERFFARARAEKTNFEFPTDGHWNSLAHEMAAQAIAESAVFSIWRQSFTRRPIAQGSTQESPGR